MKCPVLLFPLMLQCWMAVSRTNREIKTSYCKHVNHCSIEFAKGMRLTADVLLRAEHYINPYLDRELNLRGFKIPAIENLAILQDQFDVIDFSDNDLKKMDNFPSMQRLNALILNNNSIARIGSSLSERLPKLTTVILTNNRVANLAEIDRLAEFKLECLSLLDNPVALKAQYRLYVVYKIPSLKWLDFRKVQRSEREESAKFFKTAAGKAYIAAVAQEVKALAEGAGGGSSANGNVNGNGNGSVAVALTEEQKAMVKRAIEQASTREEIDNIERQLKAGNFAFLNSVGETSEDAGFEKMDE